MILFSPVLVVMKLLLGHRKVLPAKQLRLCTAAGGDEDAQIKSITELLVRKGFIRRVDRMYKKPKPGKNRLAKWPKKLVPVRDRELQVASCPFFGTCAQADQSLNTCLLLLSRKSWVLWAHCAIKLAHEGRLQSIAQ